MFDQTAANQLKNVLRKAVDSSGIAGGNLMILKEGREIFYHEDGYADREEKLPLKRDSIFRLYSMSKPVTAAAAMILLERGEMDLFEPVGKFLDGFKNQMVEEGGRLVPAEREVMVKDLLSMTSGLVYGGYGRAGQETEALFREMDGRLLGDSPMNTLEAMNRLGGCALAFHPGTSWQYGTSADVLGAVVEVVSGMRFGEFLEKEIFKPLGMKDTGFWVPPEKRGRLAKTYADDGAGGLTPYSGNHLDIVNRMDRIPAFESGGAGLVSTIDDAAAFTVMLMNEGSLNGVRILRPATVRYMTASVLDARQQKGFEPWINLCGHSYGNLMRVMTDCGKAGIIASPGEYGWDGWLGAYFCNCPAEDLTFLFMMQKTDTGTSTLTRKLRNIVLSACCE
jgi:CubicO group peptidase (beta-lactamase class C family)